MNGSTSTTVVDGGVPSLPHDRIEPPPVSRNPRRIIKTAAFDSTCNVCQKRIHAGDVWRWDTVQRSGVHPACWSITRSELPIPDLASRRARRARTLAP